MVLQRKFTVAILTLGLSLAFSSAVFAQQQTPEQGAATTTQQQPMGRMGKHGGRMKGEGRGEMGGMLRIMRELNLTDAQQQQARTIFERFNTSTKTQRDELSQFRGKRQDGTLTAEEQERAKKLHAEMRASVQQLHTSLLAILTPEQRTQLEQREKEMKSRREEMRERRQGADENTSKP